MITAEKARQFSGAVPSQQLLYILSEIYIISKKGERKIVIKEQLTKEDILDLHHLGFLLEPITEFNSKENKIYTQINW